MDLQQWYIHFLNKLLDQNFANFQQIPPTLFIIPRDWRTFTMRICLKTQKFAFNCLNKALRLCVELRVLQKSYYIFLHLSPTKFERKWPQFRVFLVINGIKYEFRNTLNYVCFEKQKNKCQEAKNSCISSKPCSIIFFCEKSQIFLWNLILNCLWSQIDTFYILF